MLGVDDTGAPDPGMSGAEKMVDEPGYADTWLDLDRNTVGRA
ncbi:hypothetical protein [Nocardioides daphniae]|nr:hypothetical protein [Nocardioides daphniae]